MTLPTDSDRGVLSLSIDDSLYATDDTDPSNVIYEKEYVFKLEAEFDIYPEIPTATHLEYAELFTGDPLLSLTIADYCVALTYNNPTPFLQVSEDSMSTLKEFSQFDYRVVKYLGTDPTELTMPMISYTPWQGKLPVNTKCGVLVHEIQPSISDNNYDPKILTSLSTGAQAQV